MAIITQFTTDPTLIVLMDKHHAWHTAGGAHGQPGRQFPMGTPGSGLEFLQFHKAVLDQFFAWNNIYHAASAADLAAWTAVPAELKLPETGWPNPGFGSDLAVAEARINSNSPPFGSADELGIHIETTIHNWIHGAVAASSILNLPAAEKSIIAGFHSVQSTYFYKIHGLVQYWWERWAHPKLHIKEIVDHKTVVKDLVDTKYHLKELADSKSIIKDIQETGPKRIKDKDKDLVENKLMVEVIDPGVVGVDPQPIQALVEQVAALQAKAGIKRSPFIKPFMRPEVGHGITKQRGKKKQG